MNEVDESLTIDEYKSPIYRKGYKHGYSAGVDATFNPSLRWVSIKDKLPLYKEVVLVFLDSKQIAEAVYRGEYEDGVHIFRIELTREDTGERVTHWMPRLPEPQQ